MSAFLTLDALAVAAPSGRPLFSGLSASFGRERTGLVGRNGAGKSTLLRVILGACAPLSGTVSRAGRIAMLRQTPLPDAAPAAQALGIAEPLARIARIEAGTGTEADFAQADWELPARVEAALAGAGLGHIDLMRPLDTFSGGERTRIGIAGLLIAPPDLLLLDEPTNNLVRDGLAAIAGLLAGWSGGAIVVSHDRELLEGMDRILALAPTGTTLHGGGWSAYAAARDAEEARIAADVTRAGRDVRAREREAQAARERQARRSREGRAYAASGSAPKILLGRQRERAENSAGRGGTRARARIDDAAAALETARSRREVTAPLTIDLPSCDLPAGKLLLAFDDVSWSVGGRAIVRHLSFALRGPERVALSGPNGIGKTSVLRLATGRLAPDSGGITRPAEPLPILDQQLAFLAPDLSILDNMRRLNPALGDNAARAALARFAFRNVEAERPIADLSGGEALRAGLACVLGARPVPQLLLLDEPTNHLDMDSVAVIEAALRGYDGALLVVSHDPAFLAAIGVTREIALGAGPDVPKPARSL